jgi:hypothetical protein
MESVIDIMFRLESETGIDITEMAAVTDPAGKRILKTITDGNKTLYIVTEEDRKTTTEVAKILGLSTSRIRYLRQNRKLGERKGNDWYFTDAEIDNMRVRKPGKPKTSRPPD